MYRKALYEKYLSSVNTIEEQLVSNFNANQALQEEILRSLPSERNAKILDAGCGCGGFLNTLSKMGYNNLSGIEIGKEQCEFLSDKGFNIHRVDIIEFFEKTKDRYDFISMLDVLEHFNKSEVIELIPLLRKCLNEGGILLLRVPNGEAIFKGSIMYGDFTHETFFTKRSLTQIFLTYDFDSIRVFPALSFGKSIKGSLKKFLFKSYARIYKFFLTLENPESGQTFLPTQNIIGVINR